MTNPAEVSDRLRSLTNDVSQNTDAKDSAFTAMQGIIDLMKEHWTLLPPTVKTTVVTAEASLLRLSQAVVENTKAEK